MAAKSKKSLAIAFVVLLIVISAVIVGKNITDNRPSVAGTQSSAKSNVQATDAKATATIDKTFTFKAINQNKASKDIKFTVASVDRKDEIRVKGEVRRAPKGYDFLLVRVEIENTQPERLALAPADLIRLEDSNGKRFAPDYHNGNVILDPISVKKDLLSFVVNKDVKEFTFLIGELDKDKEKVQVNF